MLRFRSVRTRSLLFTLATLVVIALSVLLALGWGHYQDGMQSKRASVVEINKRIKTLGKERASRPIERSAKSRLRSRTACQWSGGNWKKSCDHSFKGSWMPSDSRSSRHSALRLARGFSPTGTWRQT